MTTANFLGVIAGAIVGTIVGVWINDRLVNARKRRNRKRSRAIPRGTGNPPGRPKKPKIPNLGPILPIPGDLPPEYPRE